MNKTLIILTAMMTFFGIGREANALTVGEVAPSVTAQDQNGEAVNLSELYGRGPVLLFFYPKAGTPGCTAQACSLRDAWPEFKTRGVQIFGVSADTVEAQRKFAENQKLPYTLLADHEGVVAKAFGVPTMMGFAKRSSFLIVDGKIAWIAQSAKTGEHAAEVNAALAELGLAEKS
jgi:peroxiredoxin Q/BCP